MGGFDFDYTSFRRTLLNITQIQLVVTLRLDVKEVDSVGRLHDTT